MMNAHTSPATMEFHDDALLGVLLGALEPHADKPLVLEYAGRTIEPGYNVTEVKAGSFLTLDCGGNPDAWHETILQVEDLPSTDGGSFMAAGKFRSILNQVATKIPLAADARVTFEVGAPGSPMQIFDAHSLEAGADHLLLRLAPRSAVCKPRHRATQAAAACCGSSIIKRGAATS